MPNRESPTAPAKASRDESRKVTPPDLPASQAQQMAGKTQRRGQVSDERERVQVEPAGNGRRDRDREAPGADEPEGTEQGDGRAR